MGRSEPSYLVVGHLNKAHGTKGETLCLAADGSPRGLLRPRGDPVLGR